MPSTSDKQAKYMTANCKSDDFRKKTGMDKDVACKFHGADKGKYHEGDQLSRNEELDRFLVLAGLKEAGPRDWDPADQAELGPEPEAGPANDP